MSLLYGIQQNGAFCPIYYVNWMCDNTFALHWHGAGRCYYVSIIPFKGILELKSWSDIPWRTHWNFSSLLFCFSYVFHPGFAFFRYRWCISSISSTMLNVQGSPRISWSKPTSTMPSCTSILWKNIRIGTRRQPKTPFPPKK